MRKIKHNSQLFTYCKHILKNNISYDSHTKQYYNKNNIMIIDLEQFVNKLFKKSDISVSADDIEYFTEMLRRW